MASWIKYKHKIESGDLIIWSINNVTSLEHALSMFVRIATSSEYNHVGIAWKPSDDVLMVFEAVKPKVILSPLRREIPFYHIPMHLDFTNDDRDYLLTRLGVEYSYLQAFLAYWFKANIGKYTICTKEVYDFYKRKNIHLQAENYRPSEIVRSALIYNEETGLVKVAE